MVNGHDSSNYCPLTIKNSPLKIAEKLTLATVPSEDPVVYEMIDRADTVGVFQIESRAQMSMLPRLRPREFYDLVIEVAIVRPGPIQGKMVHPYLRRRQGQEAVDYPSEQVRSVLEKTLGVPIFQEQAMRLAVVAAGFTPGEADQLRRAMGAFRRQGVMTPFREKLINGMLSRGYTADFAERVYQQICGFGEYGFPESHAASFALLVYVSAWLKCHHPAAFAAALLNSQPMGFYAPAQLVGDAKKHGVEVRPIDVNSSDWDCSLESPFSRDAESSERSAEASEPSALRSEDSASRLNLRLGFRLVRGLRQACVERIVQARGEGPFQTFAEFVRRTGLRAAVLKRLAQADAFGSLQMNRQATLWQALPERGPLTLFDAVDSEETPAPLPARTPLEEVLTDYSTAGLSLRPHPMSFFRSALDSLRITPAGRLSSLPNDLKLTVAGVVLLRQRPSTANGITFVTLEDETGMVNLIVRQAVWERYRRVARSAVAMIAHGRLQREAEIIHVLVQPPRRPFGPVERPGRSNHPFPRFPLNVDRTLFSRDAESSERSAGASSPTVLRSEDFASRLKRDSVQTPDRSRAAGPTSTHGPRSFTKTGVRIPASEPVVSARGGYPHTRHKNNGLGYEWDGNLSPWRNARALRSRPNRLSRWFAFPFSR